MLTMEVNSFESVLTMLTLRKMLLELRDIAPLKDNILFLINLINAVVSNNINMINNEIERFEKVYLPNVFVTHPIEYIQKLKTHSERCLDLIRSMAYYFNTDTHALNDINKLLLIADKEKINQASKIVYGDDMD